MLFRHAHVGAIDAPLEMLPEILDTVNMAVSANLLVKPMGDALMVVTLRSQAAVGNQFVGVNRGALLNVFLDDRMKRLTLYIGDDLRHHIPATLEHSHHNRFAKRGATTRTGAVPANNRLINFDLPKQGPLPVNIGNVPADMVRHTPRGLVGNAKLTLQFLRGNAMPGSGEQIDRVEPQLQRRAAVFKRRAHSRMKMMAAPLAGVGAFGLDAIPVRPASAFRADMPLTKASLEKMLDAGFVGGELGEELADRQAGFLFYAPTIGLIPTVCQGDTSLEECVAKECSREQELRLVR